MAVKHFVVSPSVKSLPKEAILEIEKSQLDKAATIWKNREEKIIEAIQEECTLKHTFGRVIIKVDTESKNWHTFSNGVRIRRERNFNEFNRRITQPTNAIVISGEGIPSGSEILIYHNSLHDTNKIFNYKSKSPDVHYYSIPEYDCFAWRDTDGNMKPMKNYEFGLRVFKPYTGHLVGLPPHEIKDTLYITTGSLSGKVVHTLKASDYQIIFQGLDGREANLIRIRHSEDDKFDREEIVAIDHNLTEGVIRGTILIGLTDKDCKNLN